MLKTDRSFHRRWEIVLADDKTSTKKPPFHIRHFLLILVLLGVLGGFLALTVPLWKSWTCVPFLSSLIPANSADYSESKAIADLRLHILYITGGVIAILTLLQTAWKNQIDHRKAEDDIQKNKNDHNRQVHAERRSRYTKAVSTLLLASSMSGLLMTPSNQKNSKKKGKLLSITSALTSVHLSRWLRIEIP